MGSGNQRVPGHERGDERGEVERPGDERQISFKRQRRGGGACAELHRRNKRVSLRQGGFSPGQEASDVADMSRHHQDADSDDRQHLPDFALGDRDGDG